MSGTGEWSWASQTLAQVQGGIFIVVAARSRRISRRYRLDGSMLVQSGGWEPLTVEFDAYLDTATRASLESAAAAGASTLSGPDSESYSNMLLVGITQGRKPIGTVGNSKRVFHLRFEESGS